MADDHQHDLRRSILALLPERHKRLNHAPAWWTESEFGNWNDLPEYKKEDWWLWDAKVAFYTANSHGAIEDVHNVVPLRALGAYSKKNALADPQGPGWRQSAKHPTTWEWPFRFKDYWNPTLRYELFCLLSLPAEATPMSSIWIKAARQRYTLASEKYEEWKRKEVQGTIDFLNFREGVKSAIKHEQAQEAASLRRVRRQARDRDPDRQIRRGIFNPMVQLFLMQDADPSRNIVENQGLQEMADDSTE